jgi:hypothetical protein
MQRRQELRARAQRWNVGQRLLVHFIQHCFFETLNSSQCMSEESKLDIYSWFLTQPLV